MTYPAEVLIDNPLVYWRLGEASGTAVADASGNGHPGTYFGAPTLGVAGLLDADADTAVEFAAAVTNQRAQSNGTVHAVGTIAACALECLVELSGGSGPDGLLIVCDPALVAPDTIQLSYQAGDPDPAALGFSFVGTGGFGNASAVVSNGVHHVVGEFTGTEIRLYVDGVLVFSDPFVDAGAVLTVANSFGIPFAGTGGSLSNSHVIDEAAFYTHALGPTRVAVHATAAGFSPPFPPVVTDVTPASGSTAGGTEVVIAGTDLTGVTDVGFGATPAASFVVDSDTQITAITPAHAAGPVTVSAS